MSASPSAADLLLVPLRPLLAEVVEPIERRLDELEQRLDEDRAREWYTLAEASQRLGISYDATRMQARRRRLEVRRVGRRVYVSARSVDGLP